MAAGATQRTFASTGAAEPPRRKTVNLTNVDATAELYVALAPTGAGAPSPTTTDHDVLVPPRSSRQFQIGPGIDLWLRSSATSAVAYTALELL